MRDGKLTLPRLAAGQHPDRAFGVGQLSKRIGQIARPRRLAPGQNRPATRPAPQARPPDAARRGAIARRDRDLLVSGAKNRWGGSAARRREVLIYLRRAQPPAPLERLQRAPAAAARRRPSALAGATSASRLPMAAPAAIATSSKLFATRLCASGTARRSQPGTTTGAAGVVPGSLPRGVRALSGEESCPTR